MSKWKYVWLDKEGNPQHSERFKLGRNDVYVPEFIWSSDDAIKSYLETLTRVEPLVRKLAGVG